MGNGYFRTSQTSTTSRQRDKRGKESYSYQHNYVDRVRLEDTNATDYQQQSHYRQHDPRCPQLRAAGWRHTHKSVSHLDLATSCHGAAGAGIDRPHRQQLQVQLRHHHQTHHHHQEQHPQPPLTPHAQPHWTQCRLDIAAASAGQGQLRNARSLDYTQLEREENALDIAEFYWHFDAEAPLEQLDNNYATNDNLEPATAAASTDTTAEATIAATPAAAAATGAALGATVTATFLDFGSDSCSLRRSRSLAVIREETFSDLQIGSANSSRRRSQLIPRARLVNRGFFRESPRLNNKQQQAQSEQPTDPAEDAQSNSSGANTCDSHQQQHQQQLLKQQQQQKQLQQQQQQQVHHHCPQRHQRHQRDPHDFDVYYDNLKRLDALALGLSEQLHPWHNDKSDLESLNSDYFKNSLHQNHGEQQQQPSSLEFEALEQAVTLLSERPRIYQSRRQQHNRSHHYCQPQHKRNIDLSGESCPEHSQSSVFPETTTSNSDDQTDTPSLSEQEYDLTHIEQIFQQTDSVDVEESYELISLTTTTQTRFESSEEEGETRRREEHGVEDLTGADESLTTPTETAASDSDGTLKRAHSEQLDKLIAYDSVYLSSEDSSDCTLIGESCESFEQRTFTSCLENGELETRSLLHISIEDTVYEPQPKQHKKEKEVEQQRQKERDQQQPTNAKIETQIFTQVLKVEHATPSNHINVGVTSSAASKPRILSVVEKRKLKQEELKQLAPPELKRQATDTFVVKSAHKSNLTENQYHSLPDVNISVSLKACENIDKELRSSYNLQRQQQRKETKRQKGEVTRAETYDSIRRFGRAHQKARQREYEEREKQREKEEATQVSEKETKQQSEPHQVAIKEPELSEPIDAEVVAKEEEEEEEEPLPPPPPPITEDEFNDNDNESFNDNVNVSVNDNQLVSLSHPEKPKEAPVIEVANFSKLIERRAQELRHQRAKEQTELQIKEQQSQSFQIIVTDAHNNVIQTEAIQEEQTKKKTTTLKSNPTVLTNSVLHSHTPQRSLRRSNSSACGKPQERRVLSAGASIYKARPIKVLSTTSGDNSFGRQKMSRPQILHVVDSSKSCSNSSSSNSLRRRSSARSIASNVSGEVATEYLQKVDAVKCYWNKLAGASESDEKADIKPEKEMEPRLHFQLGNKVTPSNGDKAHGSLDYCSIMPPSIEIVELGDGSQKATIVSAAQQEPNGDGDDDDDDGNGGAQFDHIRYKVLKSQQLIRNSNILTPRNKKEAQFDGLIQYLQDYSFQELLSNNNVVIVEPVRTKIERPLTVGANVAPAKPPRLASTQAQQATAAAAPKKTRQRQVGGAGAKRHFFYQPVRVNRELYEDELPDPDTVRNVRRFFEQNILPTPGQGILVQSQQKFGGSACQLSPKSRRARGYRYLTIDTSYGGDAATDMAVAEEQPKGMEQLMEEHKVKHWDNASLSSGISSGDLSSPCGDCHNQPESMTKESPTLACQGVHVLDVVRRHNSNAANAKARAKLASRRTWCVGGGIAAGDSRYRQIYEHNLEAQDEDAHHAADNDGDDDDDDYDNRDEEDDDNVETDMCESYYVSNDVLAKIRECGSTVTYYGGRVMEQRQTSERMTATMQPNRKLINGNAVNDSSTLSTRSRVRQIESCNVCPPAQRCEHELQQKNKQLEQQQQDSSYQGIKFKLVKSNSCSSRLELAGANDGEGGNGSDSMLLQADTEVVRKMVHHFECNQPTATPTSSSNDVNLTINSQSTAAKNIEATARRQVTVNNHINVLKEQIEHQDVHDKQNEASTTYQSQAMNIRLDLSAGRSNNSSSNSDKLNNISKVCRNKNVDLAYTLSKPTAQADAKALVNQVTPHGNQLSQLNALDEQQMTTKTTTKQLIKQPEMFNGREQIIVPVQIHQTQQQQQQHSAAKQERRLSNASSSASIVDKTVVRHYVANDKSIYERRKYDEIEFEEFEVYDPAKELERQQKEQEQQSPAERTKQSNDSIDRRHTDGELYDSLDDRM